MYAAVLDANVLVPNALCDTLLRLAERGFYRPLWTELILNEARWTVEKVHPELSGELIRGRFEAMNATFEDALVEGWEAACAGMDLPDENDRHVVAAAVRGGGQSIVTFNLRDFPEHLIKPYDIEVKDPDEFLLDQLDLHPGAALQALREQAADLARPPSDLSGVLNRLERCGVPQFADAIRLLAEED